MEKPFDPNAAAPPDSGIFGLDCEPDEAKVILLAVPFEATTSYGGGTAGGPQAILNASRQVDLFDLDNGSPYEAGIALIDEDEDVVRWNEQAKDLAAPIIASAGVGDPAPVNALSEQMNAWVYQHSKAWMARGKLVGVIGGDHSVPLGNIQACAEKHGEIGVLHLDAHADLRDAYEGFTFSHASIMFNVLNLVTQVTKLVQVGIRDFSEGEYRFIQRSKGRCVTFFDRALSQKRDQGVTWQTQVNEIVAQLPDKVYLSWDIDGLDPTLCPHTGTPVPGGLSFHQATALLDGVVQAGKKIVGFDLCEVTPGPAGDEWDANVGARILYKMIGFALRAQ